MQAEAIELKQFDMLQDDACEQRIVAAKVAPGKRAIILSHHYQRKQMFINTLTWPVIPLNFCALPVA